MDKKREDEILWKAIRMHQGEQIEIGTTVAHPDDPITYELQGYEGDQAIFYFNGITKRFPAKEIFSVGAVAQTAVLMSMVDKAKERGQNSKTNA